MDRQGETENLFMKIKPYFAGSASYFTDISPHTHKVPTDVIRRKKMKKYIIRLVALALWLVAGQQGQALRQAPALRPFYPLIADLGDRSAVTVVDGFRVLQLNMLADGLSGLRADLGAFSRAKADDLNWDFRKTQLLREILQYKPDLITLQECDHYYDFFLPELMSLGYDGLFAPKPSSACLEVSENSDGCAIFLKKDKFRVVSSEVREAFPPPPYLLVPHPDYFNLTLRPSFHRKHTKDLDLRAGQG